MAQQVGAGDPIAGSRRQSSEKITFQWIKRRAAAGSDPSVVNHQARVAGFLEKCPRARLRLRRDEAVERCHAASQGRTCIPTDVSSHPSTVASSPRIRSWREPFPSACRCRQAILRADVARPRPTSACSRRSRAGSSAIARRRLPPEPSDRPIVPTKRFGPPKRKIAPQGRDSGCRSTLCPEGTGRWRRGWDSNPRYGITVNRISNPAHSTTLPPLRKNGRRTRVIGRPAYRSPHPGAHLSRCACFVLGACAATRGTQRKGAHDTGPRPGKQPVGGRIVRCATDRGRRGSRRARCAPRPGPPGGMPSAPDRDRCPRSRRARRDVRSRG